MVLARFILLFTTSKFSFDSTMLFLILPFLPKLDQFTLILFCCPGISSLNSLLSTHKTNTYAFSQMLQKCGELHSGPPLLIPKLNLLDVTFFFLSLQFFVCYYCHVFICFCLLFAYSVFFFFFQFCLKYLCTGLTLVSSSPVTAGIQHGLKCSESQEILLGLSTISSQTYLDDTIHSPKICCVVFHWVQVNAQILVEV